MEEFKIKAKEVKKSVDEAKNLGRMKDLGENVDSKVACQAARNILGIKKNLAPTAIKDATEGLITDLAKIATKLNNYFLEKVKKPQGKNQLSTFP